MTIRSSNFYYNANMFTSKKNNLTSDQCFICHDDQQKTYDINLIITFFYYKSWIKHLLNKNINIGISVYFYIFVPVNI